MRRSSFWVQLSIIFLGTFLFSLSCAAAKPIKLSYSVFFPATHGQAKLAVEWAKEIEKRTQGEVKITVFPGSALLGANQTFDGVRVGIADIGMSCFAYNRGRFPVMEVVDLPMGYPNGLTATRVINEFYAKTKPQELQHVQVLYLHAHGPGLLLTKKPIYRLEDLKNQKIRSTGISAQIVSALGGVPVAMPQPMTYEALQKQIINGTFGPIEVLKGWRQAEVIQYITDSTKIGYTVGMYVVMNPKKWNQLTPTQQKIIQDVSAEWIDRHGMSWDSSDEEGKEFAATVGNKFISLSLEEQERWVKAVRPILQAYAQQVAKLKISGKKNIDLLFALIQAHSSSETGKKS